MQLFCEELKSLLKSFDDFRQQESLLNPTEMMQSLIQKREKARSEAGNGLLMRVSEPSALQMNETPSSITSISNAMQNTQVKSEHKEKQNEESPQYVHLKKAWIKTYTDATSKTGTVDNAVSESNKSEQTLKNDVASGPVDVDPASGTVYSHSHKFEKHNYTTPTSCDVCHSLLWGPRTGLRCIDCGFNVHEKCRDKAPKSCTCFKASAIPKDDTTENFEQFQRDDATPKLRVTNSDNKDMYHERSEEISTQPALPSDAAQNLRKPVVIRFTRRGQSSGNSMQQRLPDVTEDTPTRSGQPTDTLFMLRFCSTVSKHFNNFNSQMLLIIKRKLRPATLFYIFKI